MSWQDDRRMSRISIMFSWLNLVKIFISRRVLWQYVWCSKGLIFLIATWNLVYLLYTSECKYSTDSYLCLCLVIIGRYHHAIGSLSYVLEVVVPVNRCFSEGHFSDKLTTLIQNLTWFLKEATRRARSESLSRKIITLSRVKFF